MSGGDEYVVAAYAVIWVVMMLYVVVIAAKTARLNRDAELLTRLIEERDPETRQPSEADGAE